MKKMIAVIGLAGIIAALILFGGGNAAEAETEYLRIHIRANSNEYYDQSIKYEIKDKIVEYLTPFLAECSTKKEALEVVDKKLKDLERVADKVLDEKGKAYGAKAKLNQEDFPTRAYDGFVLEGGVYDALIISLGEGTGDNWWCVVYPPLCFVPSSTSGEGFKYKSKILEIIEKFKKTHE